MSIYGELNSDDIEINPQIPAGCYPVMISGEEVVEKDDGRKFIKLTYEITDGEFKGQSQVEIINLWHENPTVVQISQAKIKKICLATNKKIVNEGDRLKGGLLCIHIRPQKNNPNYNEVHKYESAFTVAPAGVDKEMPF